LHKFPVYNIVFISILGFIAFIATLPYCTPGMYIVYNALMSEASISKRIIPTILYNQVFISPLILITLTITGITLIPNIYPLLLSKRDYFRAIGGLIAIIMAIYCIIIFY